MIKIIKQGKKEFHCTCDRCECEFICELEDLHYEQSLTGVKRARTVTCPTCGNTCYIDSNVVPRDRGIDWLKQSELIPCNTTDPCIGCDWHDKVFEDGKTYIGDTPCTWCDKKKFYVNNLNTKVNAICGGYNGTKYRVTAEGYPLQNEIALSQTMSATDSCNLAQNEQKSSTVRSAKLEV